MGAGTAVSIDGFLLARIAEDEERARAWRASGHDDSVALAERVLADCQAKRFVVELHEAWPVVVEDPPSLEYPAQDLHEMSRNACQEVAWLTMREYVSRFGIQPPTAPILMALAASYSDHDDYQEDWAL